MAYPIIFGSASIGLMLITLVWSALIFLPHRGHPAQLLGPIGTLAAAVSILGLWVPRTTTLIWFDTRLTFQFWLMTFMLIGLALLLAFVLRTTHRDRILAAVCGGAGLLLNAAAFFTFMAYATLSPGGV